MFRTKEIFLQIENNIKSIINQKTPEGERLWKMLLKQHPADIAKLVDRINPQFQEKLIKRLPKELMDRVFAELDELDQSELLIKMDDNLASLVLRNLQTDQLTDLFDNLSDEDLKKYMCMLQKKQRHRIISLLNFDSHAAGRRMNSQVLTLQSDFTVKKSVNLLQRFSPKKEMLRRIYVTDKEHKLIGHINLDDLILNKPDVSLSKIFHKNEMQVDAYEDQESVANQMRHYGLVSAPVVDKKKHFLGVITADDIFEIIEEEASEDVYKMSGMQSIEHSYFDSPLLTLVFQRGIWLVALLLLQTISSFIVSGYSELLSNNVILTFFLTALIGTGGNAGNQSSAIVIRGLATGEIGAGTKWKLLARELGVSILMAFMVVAVGFVRVYFYLQVLRIASIVSLALFFIVITSVLIGAFLPLMLDKLKIDPAHSAAPFLATVMDIIGVLIYFFIASKMLG